MRTFGRNCAASMISAALTMRLFIGLSVDFPTAHNAAWMCPLFGFIIFLPMLFALRLCEPTSICPWNCTTQNLPRPIKAIFQGLFTLILVYDAASNLRLTASSSNIIALGDITVHLLAVPLGIAAAIVILLGGNALGDSARISLRFLPLLMTIVILVQLGEYRFGWLTPILGSGFTNVLRGSIYCAGCMALFSLSWLIAEPGKGKTSIIRCFLFPAVGVSILMLMYSMSAPAMPTTQLTRAARIELVLSNGRMSLYPQFLLNILWYGGLLYLIATECVTAAAYLQNFSAKIKVWETAAAISTTVTVTAIFNPFWLKYTNTVTCILFPALAGLLILPLVLHLNDFRRTGI